MFLMEKSNRLKKYKMHYSKEELFLIAAIVIKKNRKNQKQIFFGLTMKYIQELLLSAVQLKWKCEYEGVNWHLVRSKNERVQEIIVELYLKTSEENKDFPN